MTGKVGLVEDNRVWIRCPECGDSQHDLTKAHLNVDLRRFIYHCYRCGYSGKLSASDAFKLFDRLNLEIILYINPRDLENRDPLELPELIPGAGSDRRSLLSRFHLPSSSGTIYDAFEMRDPRDNVICGIHLRSGNKKLTLGDSGFSWVGDEPILSSFDDPIILVEGPYDVIDPKCLCMYGFLSSLRLGLLKGHTVALCPDGDVWLEKFLFSRIARTIQKMLSSQLVYLYGLYMLPNGLDPDEVDDLSQFWIPRAKIKDRLEEAYNRLPLLLRKETVYEPT